MVKKAFLTAISALVLLPSSVYAIDYTKTPDYVKMNNFSSQSATVAQRVKTELPGLMEKKPLKEQIKTIKDENKRKIAEKISSRISSANTDLTSKMQKSLDRMNEFVLSISSKGATLKSQQVDTTALEAAIINAQNAIQTAKLAVTTQKGKTYTTDVSDETLRPGFGAMVSQFRQDISATHQTVMDAKKAVISAMQELMKLSPAKENTTPSVTKTQ